MDFEVWACPVCFSELSQIDDHLGCALEGRSFPRMDGLPVLVTPDQEPLLRDAKAFASAWKKTKWAVPAKRLRELPSIRGLAWQQKAQSLRKLMEMLGTSRNRKLVDAGAGTGWLSYRLTQQAFRCFATDISSDSDVGLGAATQFDETPYRFERAIASLDRWPFRSGSVDIAICNASIHYVADVRVPIAEAARVLRSGGTFVIMNSPVHLEAGSAHRASRHFQKQMLKLGACSKLLDDHQHFVASELEDRMRDRFLRVTRHEPRNGFRFKAMRALKGTIASVELASFPIYEGQLP